MSKKKGAGRSRGRGLQGVPVPGARIATRNPVSNAARGTGVGMAPKGNRYSLYGGPYAPGGAGFGGLYPSNGPAGGGWY